MDRNFDDTVISEGKAIFAAVERGGSESLFDKEYWFGMVMDFVMKDPSFKIDLFRFVDVLPSLVTSDQVAKHIKEYLIKPDRHLPLVISTALKTASMSFAKGIASSAIKKNVVDMASRFIAGTDIHDAMKRLKKLEAEGFSFTIDVLGEKTLSESEADFYEQRYTQLIESLPKLLAPSSRIIDVANVSIKISALSSQLHEEDPEYSVRDAERRVVRLLRLAKKNNVFINFDVENFQTHEIVNHLFLRIARSEEFSSWPHFGIVVQAYLKDSEQHLSTLIDCAKARNCPITIRLVKGAYWDYEVIHANASGHVPPVFLQKPATDICYEKLSRILLDNVDVVRPAFGSHNIRSLAHAIAYAKHNRIDATRYEIQMLYGMAENERRALLDRGNQVRIYVPIGEMLPGMSYLVRRLLENTSQMGFVKMSHHDRENRDELLKAPNVMPTTYADVDESFVNTPHADFTDKKVRNDFAAAISQVKKMLPMRTFVSVGGVTISSTKQSREHVSPNDRSIVVASCSLADLTHVEDALSLSMQSAIHQSLMSERVKHLRDLAKILARDRYFLSAVMAFEVGKTWSEADADVAEAVDFCNYYAMCAETELAPQIMGNVMGENNVLSFVARGPTVVIAPWNFPLAILCGMSVAAYVAGNPILMKPSEQSMLTAYMLYERMMEAGFIKSATHFLPGVGEIIGAHMITHKDVATICFTGSMKVGHEIMKSANTVVPGQRQMKRVVCEMGGKNAIIVDDDADLDEAVSAIIKSAFSYAGQKCSAASRIIAVDTIFEPLVERLVDATRSIKVGNSIEPSTFMGPVVDEDSYDRLLKQSKKLANDDTVKVLEHSQPVAINGFFVPCMIVQVSNPDHWVMQEELFGPIIAVYHAPDLAHAVTVANNTRYALTGGLFSRSPANIAYVRDHFSVGNLYINQKCTGALVHRQPFGGFKMSGTGIKAGGPHYLLNFVDQKLVSENTMRRGFTPEVA